MSNERRPDAHWRASAKFVRKGVPGLLGLYAGGRIRKPRSAGCRRNRRDAAPRIAATQSGPRAWPHETLIDGEKEEAMRAFKQGGAETQLLRGDDQ